MAETRPIGEQLRFLSQATGEHILDDYLEASEKGGRTVPDLLGDIFSATNGKFRSDTFEFREDPDNQGFFQVRIGQYIDADTGWQTFTFSDFAQYVADALSYRDSAEASKDRAVLAETTVTPILNNLSRVLLVSDDIENVNTVSEQVDGTRTHVVTVSGGKFYIDNVQQPNVVLKYGTTYTFDLSDSSQASHPFRFSINPNGGPEYTTGVTVTGTQGQAGAQLVIEVDENTPPLYYYCTAHSNMGAAADVREDNLQILANIDDKITTAADVVAPNIQDVITTATNIQDVGVVSTNVADVNTVAASIDNVDTVGTNIGSVTTVANTGNLASITTAATYISQIGTVAGNIDDVNDVVANISDINTAAANVGAGLDITTVATNIGSVSVVGTNITDVQTVAANISSIQNVSQDLLESISEIDTVAQSITNVDAVGTNINSVVTVSNTTNLTNIATVAADISDVNSLAGISTKVRALADIEDGTVETNALTGLYGDLATIQQLGANITDLVTTAQNITSVTTAATNIANINTVAPYVGNTQNIGLVAASITDVNNVAAQLDDLNSVADNLDDLDTVASNISDVVSAGQNIQDIAVAATYVNQIIEAPNYAEDAKNYASYGINSTFQDRDGNFAYSAKHWASVAQAVGNAFTTVQGDERTSGDTDDITAVGAADSIQFLGLGGAKVRTDQTNQEVYIDSRSVAMAIALG